jgi:alginate O-acetyltransferase complex protein AlgI
MSFVSCTFLVFICLVWACFFLLPARIRPFHLTISSYIFYGTWSLPFLLMILVTTSVDYLCSRLIHKSESQRTRKMALISAIVINVLVLGCFKYLNFLLGSTSFCAAYCGLASPVPKHLQIILPSHTCSKDESAKITKEITHVCMSS